MSRSYRASETVLSEFTDLLLLPQLNRGWAYLHNVIPRGGPILPSCHLSPHWNHSAIVTL